MLTIMYWLDLFGVAIFAVTGALGAGKKHMDLFGVVVLAEVTALGGGTLRDLILGIKPVFWVSAPIYILVAAIMGMVLFFCIRFWHIPGKFLTLADTFGLAVFTVVGTEKALDMGTNWIIAVVMGVMTGVVGGIVRDVLSGEIPLILRKEIYATASLCGAIAFCFLYLTVRNQSLAISISLIVTLCLRFSAIKWNLSLPHYSFRQSKNKNKG